MPKTDPNLLDEYIKSLAKKCTKLQQNQFYSSACKLYEVILSHCNDSIKYYKKYIECLKKAKNYQRIKVVCQFTLTIFPQDLQMYNVYISYLQQRQLYKQMKSVIILAIQKLQPIIRLDKKMGLYASYAKACHRSQTFQDGLKILQKIQTANKDEFVNNVKVLLWKIYLLYQIGSYNKAVIYSDFILKLDLRSDRTYYQIQKCKYCILIGNYQQSLKLANKIITNFEQKQLKTKLKAYALKAYCYYSQKNKNLTIQTMKTALNLDRNDVMLQFKLTLFYLMQLPTETQLQTQPQNNKNTYKEQLQKNCTQKILNYVMNKMFKCNFDNFDNTTFSQHYNWYSELNQYRNHVKFLVQYFNRIGQFLDLAIQFTNKLYISLIEGYEDSCRTNLKLYQLKKQIENKLKYNLAIEQAYQQNISIGQENISK